MPEPDTTIIWTHVFEWYVVECGSKNGRQKRHVRKRGWITCSSTHVGHSRFDSQHDMGNSYDHFTSMGVFVLTMYKIFMRALSINHEQMGEAKKPRATTNHYWCSRLGVERFLCEHEMARICKKNRGTNEKVAARGGMEWLAG